jgi:hypothetical protein
MRIEKRTLGWVQKQSAWQEMQARREKSTAYRKKFEQQQVALNNMLQTSALDQFTGAGDLAARAALKRLDEAAKAKTLENQRKAEDEATRALIWKNDKPSQTTIKAGDTTIDLKSGVVTMSDGTRINASTGMKADNYLTLADGSRIDLSTGLKVIDVTV